MLRNVVLCERFCDMTCDVIQKTLWRATVSVSWVTRILGVWRSTFFAHNMNILGGMNFVPKFGARDRVQGRPRFDPRPVLVRFVVHIVALGQVFLWSTWVVPCQHGGAIPPY